MGWGSGMGLCAFLPNGYTHLMQSEISMIILSERSTWGRKVQTPIPLSCLIGVGSIFPSANGVHQVPVPLGQWQDDAISKT